MKILAAFVLIALAPTASAQVPGYAPASATMQAAIERSVIASPHPDSIHRYVRALTAEPHIAGTDAQARTRDYVIERMRAWGIDTHAERHDVWMPHPVEAGVWRIASLCRGCGAGIDGRGESGRSRRELWLADP